MAIEPALRGVADVESILGVLPVPLILVEPGTGRMLYANDAALRLAGDPSALEDPRLYEPTGRALTHDEIPSVRAARGEVVQHVLLDWETAHGMRTLLVSGTMIDGLVTVVTFEDATEVEAARRRSNLLADELRVMLDGVADAITVQTQDGLIYANEAAIRDYGIPRDLTGFVTVEYLARWDLDLDDGRPLELARLPGRLALAGLDPKPVTIRARDRATGELRWSRVQATAVGDPDGGVRLAINVIEDITELKRSEETQRFLAEASRTLAGSLDYERTLAEVTSLAVPAIADRCAVSMAGADDLPLEAFAVLRTGAARVEPGRMIVPMTAAGRVIGTITLEVDGRSYDAQDVLVAEDFGLRVGAAVENARLYRAASRMARTLQTSLLPPHLPDIPGASLAAAYLPAWEGLEVGGDFYDVFSTAEGQWYLVIGDVCGKGPEAAAVTALARHSLRTAAARRRSPAEILRWVGEAMLQHDPTGTRFCTIACAHVDLTRRPAPVTVSCGGHPLPVVRRADGSVDPIGAQGTLLGLLPDPELADGTGELWPGDTLLLYTDGLTEARAPRAMWGPAELAAAIRAAPDPGSDSPEELVAGLVASALGDRAAPRDDLAVLALKLARQA